MALFIIADQRYPRRAKENDNYETEKLAKMTRSSGVFDSSPVQRRRRPVTLDEVADSGLYLGSRKACRVSDFANEDTDDIRSKSYNKDRALLDDITNKLEASSFTHGVPAVVKRSAGGRRPPPSPATIVGGRRLSTPLTTAPVRRVGYRPVPSLHVPTSYYRASSVPPRARYVEEEIVTPYNYYEVPGPTNVDYPATDSCYADHAAPVSVNHAISLSLQ